MNELAYTIDTRPWWVKLPDFLTGWIRKNPYTAVLLVLSVGLYFLPGCEGKAVSPSNPTGPALTAAQLEAEAARMVADAAERKAALKRKGDTLAASLRAELDAITAETGEVDRKTEASLSAYGTAIDSADAQTAKNQEQVQGFGNLAASVIPGMPPGLIPLITGFGVAIDNRRKDRLIADARKRGFNVNPANAPSTPNIANTAPG